MNGISAVCFPVSHCGGDVSVINSSMSTSSESVVIVKCDACGRELAIHAYIRAVGSAAATTRKARERAAKVRCKQS